MYYLLITNASLEEIRDAVWGKGQYIIGLEPEKVDLVFKGADVLLSQDYAIHRRDMTAVRIGISDPCDTKAEVKEHANEVVEKLTDTERINYVGIFEVSTKRYK